MRDKQANGRGYDFNFLLNIFNLIVCLSAAFAYQYNSDNQYVNMTSIVLLCLLGIENILMLLSEKKKRDPFILILVANTLFFFMLRVFSLSYDPDAQLLAGDVISNSPYNLNNALIFILVCNAVIFLGLRAARGKICYKTETPPYQYPANPKIILIIMLVPLLTVPFGLISFQPLERLLSLIMQLISNSSYYVFFTIVYLLVNKSIKTIYRNALYVAILILPLTMTLQGSRSGILTIFLFIMFGVLSVKGKIIIKRKVLVMIGILAVISIVFFSFATKIRRAGIGNKVISGGQVVLSSEWGASGFGRQFEDQMRQISKRMGYLDYSVHTISDSVFYRKFINIEYYVKSIIDNGLTPGFDLFDTLRVSTLLKFLRSSGEIVGRSEAWDSGYHSDFLTIYGESYVVGYGYFVLPFIFLISYGIKKIYMLINNKDIFLFNLYRGIVLMMFYKTLNSYGLDWTVINIISIIIIVVIFKRFFEMKKKIRIS